MEPYAIIPPEENSLLRAYREAGERRARVVPEGDPDAAALARNHGQAVAAQDSTFDRLDRAARTLAVLRTNLMRALIAEQHAVDGLLAAMDPAHPLHATIVAAGDQSLEAIIDVYLRLIRGVGEIAAAQAGEDMRPRGDGGDPDAAVDRYFGAIVTPPYWPRLQPRQGRDGSVSYRVVDPGGYHG